MRLLKRVCRISALVLLSLTAAVAPAFAITMGKLDVTRILYLGNSITIHGSDSSIGWEGNWGMAASAQAKDYVHVLTSRIAAKAGGTPTIKIGSLVLFEKYYDTYNASKIRTELASTLSFNPTLIVLAIGENVPTLSTDAQKAAYTSAYGDLISVLQESGNPPIFARGSFWSNTTKDPIMKTVAEAHGCSFVSLSSLWGQEQYNARSESYANPDWDPGVGVHPGDRGMAAISDALMTKITAVSTPEPSTFALATIGMISIAAYRLRCTRKKNMLEENIRRSCNKY
jgi:hypothetical protein